MKDQVIELSSDSSTSNSQNCDEHKSISENDNNTEIYFPQHESEKIIGADFYNFSNTDLPDLTTLGEQLSRNKVKCQESGILADLPPVNLIGKTIEDKVNRKKTLSKIRELSDSDGSIKYTEIDSGKIKRKGRGKNTTAAVNEERERKKAERLEKQAQKMREKTIKQMTNEALRSKKPEECLKYVKVCLDQELLSSEFGGQILVELQAGAMQYSIQSNRVVNSILWIREILEPSVGEDMQLNVEKRVKEESEVVIIWKWGKVVELVKNGDFLTELQVIQTLIPGKKLTLIVYDSKQYFKYQKSSKRREVRANVLGTELKSKTNKKEANFESMPQISEDDWEVTVTQLQLFGYQHIMLDTAADMATYVRQFTKAVAEAPYKQEKQQQDLGDVNWYGDGDSRDCVRVDKNGNGLLRLWQQQLCQFNSVGLETAQAIAAVYGSPTALIRAYENCSTEQEASLLLASIPVRRGVGPLTSIRSVGPELSKKMHAFFTCLYD